MEGKKIHKVHLSVLLTIVTFVLALVPTATLSGSSPAPVSLTILFTNDAHGRLEQWYKWKVGMVGGIAQIATLVENVQAQVPNVLLLDAGDTFLGSVLANYFDGKPVVEAMNLVGYDAMAIGNHEFDHGQGVLDNRSKEAQFPLLAANLRWKENLQQIPPWAKDYWVFEVAGLRIAVFGLITPDLPVVTHPKHVENLAVLDPIEVAENYVPYLKENENADLIVALTHLGLELDNQLAAAVENIDVIVGGHSHSELFDPVITDNTIIVQAGEYYMYLGRLDLEVGSEVTLVNYELISTIGVPPDPEVEALVENYSQQLENIFGQVIGETLVPLDGARGLGGIRTRETNLGNLVADAYKWYLRREGWELDFVVQNGGGIRWHRLFPPGPITLGDVHELLPFPNVMVVVRLPGENIWKALERSVSEFPDEEGGFLHISDLKFVFDPAKPPFQRVENVWVWENGAWAPLDNAENYWVAMNDFLAAGGDDYVEFLSDNVVYTGVPYAEPFRAYVENITPIDNTEARWDNRIIARGYRWVQDAYGYDQHSTIQEAVDEALPGDKIMVLPGTYGSFEIRDKADLSIIAARGGVTIADENVFVLVLVENSENIRLEDLTLDGSTELGIVGVLAMDNAEVRIEGCRIINCKAVEEPGIGVVVGLPPEGENMFGIPLGQERPVWVELRNSEVRNNSGGIFVDNDGFLVANFNDIACNDQFGLLVVGERLDLVNAENNWWGHVSGPREPLANPLGLGDQLFGLTVLPEEGVEPQLIVNVDYDPWLLEPVGAFPIIENVVAVPSLVSLPEYLFGFPFSSGPSWAWLVAKVEDDVIAVTADLRALVLQMLPEDVAIKPGLGDNWLNWLSSLKHSELHPIPCGAWGLELDLSRLWENIRAFVDYPSSKLLEILRLGEFSIPITALDHAGNGTESDLRLTVVSIQLPLERGWNLRSIPVTLDDGYNTWGELAVLSGIENLLGATLRYDTHTKQWVHLAPEDLIRPLEAMWIYVPELTQLALIFENDLTEPPILELGAGWNLMGLAGVLESSIMPAHQALTSLDEAENGLPGYTQAISLRQQLLEVEEFWYENCLLGEYHKYFVQDAWTFSKGYWQGQFMQAGGGYWVYLENPDELAGFSYTPVPLY